ncbi:MAG: Sir2 family NAD-dependent protein deacetylase [Coprococcus sp.]
MYHQSYKYSPEQVVSHSFFMKYPDVADDFYKNKMMFLDAKPNPALSETGGTGKSRKITCERTQNIDGLHWRSGKQSGL